MTEAEERKAFEEIAQRNQMGSYSVTRKDDGYWSSHTQLMWLCWKARAALSAPPEWIPVSERLPAPGVTVLVAEGKHVLRAFHAPRFTLDTDSWGEFEPDGGEYDEATDANYFPEGWYECNRHEETHWELDSEPTHWMPLPQPPGAPQPQEQK